MFLDKMFVQFPPTRKYFHWVKSYESALEFFFDRGYNEIIFEKSKTLVWTYHCDSKLKVEIFIHIPAYRLEAILQSVLFQIFCLWTSCLGFRFFFEKSIFNQKSSRQNACRFTSISHFVELCQFYKMADSEDF
jgi:hypothetical protein